jgi:ethanolamine utilization protein EutQ
MASVIHFSKDSARYEQYGQPSSGTSKIAHLIGTDISKTMGGGLAQFDGVSIEWTVLYDEIIVTLEGVFKLRVEDIVYEVRQGDVIWIPENTHLRYEGEKATIFYALAPVNWRNRHSSA